MSNSTTYDIRMAYTLEDRTSGGLKTIDSNLDKTSRKSSGLANSIKRMAAGAGAYFGIRAGVKHLIGFNANLEQSRITMAGMINMSTDLGAEAATGAAAKMVDQLQQKAKASVGTTQDMVDMATMITRPVLAAGIGMKKLADFTSQAVVASRAFGIESGMAARDIESALMGQLRSVDRFSRALLEPIIGAGQKARETFNAMSAEARAATLQQALGGPAIMAMAKAQEQSFSGAMSTFQDTLQMTMGAVGKPLFKEITAEIRTWNEWIDKNGDKLAETAKSFSRGLVSGFKMIKSVVGFMIQHSGVLLTIGKVWAGAKIGKMVSGGLGGIAERLSDIGTTRGRNSAGEFMKVRSGLGKFTHKIGGAVTKFGGLLPAVGAVTTGLYGLYRAFDDIGDRTKSAAAGEKSVRDLSITTVKDFSENASTDKRIAALAEKQRLRDLIGLKKPSASERAIIESLRPLAQGLKTVNQKFAVQAQMTGAAEKAFMGEGRKWERDIASSEVVDSILAQVGAPRRGTDQDAYFAAYKAVLKTSESMTGLLAEYENPREAWNAALAGDLLPRAITRGLLDAEYADKVIAPVDERNRKEKDVKVTIQRIEVQSDDPSRFMVGLTEAVRDTIRNRSAAFDVLLEGS